MNIIASTQASNIINNRSDLFTLKQPLDNVLKGQARDRARVETLATSLENLLSKSRTSTIKKWSYPYTCDVILYCTVIAFYYFEVYLYYNSVFLFKLI